MASRVCLLLRIRDLNNFGFAAPELRLQLTTIWYSVFSLLNAFTWDVPGLLITRCLTGVGLSAMTVVAITYVSEMFPTDKRGRYQAWIMTVGLFGIPFSALVAGDLIPRLVYGWRIVFVFGALAIFMPLFSRKLEESPRRPHSHPKDSAFFKVLYTR